MGHTVGALFAWVCSVLKTVVVGHGEFQASVCVLERGVGREREISDLVLSWAPGVQSAGFCASLAIWPPAPVQGAVTIGDTLALRHLMDHRT